MNNRSLQQLHETDKKIEDALLKLLAEGGVSNLNVRKIYRTAGINEWCVFCCL